MIAGGRGGLINWPEGYLPWEVCLQTVPGGPGETRPAGRRAGLADLGMAEAGRRKRRLPGDNEFFREPGRRPDAGGYPCFARMAETNLEMIN